MTSLAGSLPKGDANGLGVIAKSLIDQPHRLRPVLVLLDCRKVTIDNDNGDTVPTARIRRVEVILPEDYERVEQMLRRALEKRTGVTTLPIDLEDEISDAFSGVDLHTGELPDPEDPASQTSSGSVTPLFSDDKEDGEEE